MTKEELLLKWLNYDLNKNEVEAFNAIEDASFLKRIDASLSNIDTAHFNKKESFEKITSHIKKKKNTSLSFFNVIKIAAILLISFGSIYFTIFSDTSINTELAETSQIILPDNSKVALNSNSTISYNTFSWKSERTIKLKGEAFFEVEKGKFFEVITKAGKVKVLGTKFNVKERGNFFEVICFEGLVSVSYKNKTYTLKAGELFTSEITRIKKRKDFSSNSPNWIKGSPTFEDVPLWLVFNELENYYDINLTKTNINLNRRFTGSFSNKNLELALKAITIPMQLKYVKKGKHITLISE